MSSYFIVYNLILKLYLFLNFNLSLNLYLYFFLNLYVFLNLNPFFNLFIMPVNIPDTLPAIEALRKENIFVMDRTRANHQDIRPLRIAVLNLMPVKVTTETDLIRILSNTPLQLELNLIKVMGHTPKNTQIGRAHV